LTYAPDKPKPRTSERSDATAVTRPRKIGAKRNGDDG
jgi:hypothetical protein